MARHMVERLTETPLTASTYSQRSLRVAKGRSLRSSWRSLPTRSSILGRLPGALPGSRDSPLRALGGVTLDGGDPDSEGASGLGLEHSSLDGVHDLPTKVFGVRFHRSMMACSPSSSQRAV